MKEAPKKVQERAVRDACRYRDSVDKLPVQVQDFLAEKAKASFQDLTSAMGCKGEEKLMVHECLADIVVRTPAKVLRPGKDYPRPGHSSDDDCAGHVSRKTLTCSVCGVYHGDPCLLCALCGGKGYHADNCEEVS